MPARADDNGQGIGEMLQRSLLPDRLPQAPGIELAATHLPGAGDAELGADWWDVVAMPGGAVGVAIGDVAGRGAGAATLAATLRNGLRSNASDCAGPSDALRRLNRLVDDSGREMSTLLFVVYDPATGALRGANAGHPPAIIRRANGRVQRWEAARSLPLGVIAEAQYQEDAIRLVPGDALLLFTDGLIERRGLAVGAALERLEGLVPASGSADELRTAVLDGMLRGRDHDDDIAVLTLCVVPAPD